MDTENPAIIVLPVRGLRCNGCASGLKQSLESLDGVSEALVSYDDSAATVTLSDDTQNRASLVAAVKAAGYEVPQSEPLTFNVQGMSCNGCAAGLKKTLEALPGVLEADVSFDESRATVTLDQELQSTASLQAAIEDAGYSVDIPPATGDACQMPSSANLTLGVDGMSCNGCASGLQKRLWQRHLQRWQHARLIRLAELVQLRYGSGMD